ncbi:hypothetical protein HR060_01055 [Catenovulum sp. SM1970]|uniref:hypothetical protein n=1 Tax=Marinifaba aquimaris TaxID=2741323 RepID=UPI001574B42B|nr:hypothetical protein [Marinifaba aquimaris]NTS75439.1 hypothetical protein [Marinifaba aquimaris]
MKHTFTSVALAAALFSTNAFASWNSGVIEGEYIPVRGSIESLEVSRPQLGEAPQQVGSYRIVLLRKDWRDLSHEEKVRIKRRVVVRGSFKGDFDLNTMTSSHTLMDKERTGAIYTSGDFIIPTQGDLLCSGGQILKGTEQLNLVAGTGQFAQLESGTILLNAEIHNCPGQEGFGQNNLEVIPRQGSVTFTAIAE